MRTVLVITIIFGGILFTVFNSGLVKIVSRSEATLDEEEELIRIGSLAYANWVPATKNSDKIGVTYHAEKLVFNAPNLYAPANLSTAYLIDNTGKQIHQWDPQIPDSRPWQHVELLENGDILAVAKDQYLARISWDSKVIWQLNGRYHHDVIKSAKGGFYSLRRSERYIQWSNKIFPIIDDIIDYVSADGKLLASYSVYDLVANKVLPELLEKAYQKASEEGLVLDNMPKDYKSIRLGEDSKYDILHTNSVFEAKYAIPNVVDVGDLLISVRNINLIASVQLEPIKLLWSWGQSDLEKQHNATFVDNERILIFDNRPKQRSSRVIELDPISNKIMWEYGHKKFFSYSRGAAQRLPNGNTLITESDRGKVFEINNSGEIVWEFYSPHITQTKNGKVRRSAIYRMVKYPGFHQS